MNCSFSACKSGEFKCKNGRCINNVWKCGEFNLLIRCGFIECFFYHKFYTEFKFWQMEKMIVKMDQTSKIVTKRLRLLVSPTNLHAKLHINAFHRRGSATVNMYVK